MGFFKELWAFLRVREKPWLVPIIIVMVLLGGLGGFIGTQMGFLKELWAFLRVRKKLWLAPIIIVMVLLGGLLLLAKGSVVAPFIYTLF